MLNSYVAHYVYNLLNHSLGSDWSCHRRGAVDPPLPLGPSMPQGTPEQTDKINTLLRDILRRRIGINNSRIWKDISVAGYYLHWQ